MNLPILLLLFAWVVVLLLAYFVPIWVMLRALRSPLAEICERVKRKHRQWHPRTPDDCPLCALPAGAHIAALVEITPWQALKSRRALQSASDQTVSSVKTRAANILAAASPSIHAIVSDGRRGRTDRIRRWNCQACGVSVTERKDTMLYRLKTRPQRIFEVMTLWPTVLTHQQDHGFTATMIEPSSIG